MRKYSQPLLSSEVLRLLWKRIDVVLRKVGEMGMKTKKKNALFGRYPSCDMLNNALRYIYKGQIDNACAEIIFAIEKADGYFHEDVALIVEKVKSHWAKTHSAGR